ncbi:MAG: hypothetical protein VB095_08325 [Anaerovorax sp.]|nr:hypothetical protein [Anaerovorax sp.]
MMRTQSKSFKTFKIVIMVLIIAWIFMFATDYIRCSSLKTPIFVIAGEIKKDGGSGQYFGLGYTVDIKKNLSAEYGVTIESVEMSVLGNVVSASIQ